MNKSDHTFIGFLFLTCAILGLLDFALGIYAGNSWLIVCFRGFVVLCWLILVEVYLEPIRRLVAYITGD